MQKMLMLLLIIMHIVFTASYFINSGIIFFTKYFWFFFCILTFVIGLAYMFAKLPSREKNVTYKIMAFILTLISLLSFCFLLYLAFINPFFYLEFRN
jgi:hypothetical protein